MDEYEIDEEWLIDVPEAKGSIEQVISVGVVSASAQTSLCRSLVNLNHLGQWPPPTSRPEDP